MGKLPERYKRAKPAGRALLSAAVGAALVCPSVAMSGAAAAVRQPQVATSGAALCSGVSASQVSAVVGWTVPSPTLMGSVYSTTNSVVGTELLTSCVYGQITSLAAITQLVLLDYMHFSKVPSRTTAVNYVESGLQQAGAKMGAKGNFTYTVNNKFGVISVYASFTTTEPMVGTLTVEAAGGWKGHFAAVGEVVKALPKSAVYGLEKLALSNVGI